MKRVLCLLLVVAFAGMMLLPVASHVNLLSGNQLKVVDNGPPQPPWPPPPGSAISQISSLPA
jgi:hypothetical protein